MKPSPSDHFDLGSPIKEPLAQVQIALQPFYKEQEENKDSCVGRIKALQKAAFQCDIAGVRQSTFSIGMVRIKSL